MLRARYLIILLFVDDSILFFAVGVRIVDELVLLIALRYDLMKNY